MKKLVFLISSCFLTSLFTATSASAQTVVHVSMSNLTFVGASVCGGGNAACTETVNISFDWNVTNASIVSGSVSAPASGAIAPPFSFANTGSVANGQGFLWTDTNGDSVSVNTCGFDCGKFPSIGAYDTVDITLLCGSTGLTCFTDGFNGVHPTNGTFTVGAVPTCGSVTPSTVNSNNWVGYLVTDNSCAPTITGIVGSWIVPNSPATIIRQQTMEWVGIGGYFNNGSDLNTDRYSFGTNSSSTPATLQGMVRTHNTRLQGDGADKLPSAIRSRRQSGRYRFRISHSIQCCYEPMVARDQ